MIPARRGLCLLSICTLLMCLAIGRNAAKRIKCRDDECQMKPEHFKLYSSIKRALDQDLDIKGKDLIPLIRSVEVLKRRFSSAATSLNGTELVMRLLNNKKLSDAIELFNSNDGRQLLNVYRTSINGNHQNLACSQWRVGELEFASRKLEQSPELAKVFSNIHKNFLERSARKCLKSSCSSVDDNMNRLDSVLRKSSRRKGFLVRDDVVLDSAHNDNNNKLNGEDSNSIEEALIAQVENEPTGEFQQEEPELCRFLKRVNATSNCQASGNELSKISFVKPIKVTNETTQANLTDFLNDYQLSHQIKSGDESGTSTAKLSGSKLILTQCHAIKPMLDYHLYGLRWYQRQGLISSEQMRSRTFWCPSLSYWFEIERLCDELESSLTANLIREPTKNDNDNDNNNNNNNNNNDSNNDTFTY